MEVKQTLTKARGESEKQALSKEGSEPAELSKVSDVKSEKKTLGENVVNLPKKYSCQDCNKTFSQKNSLFAHRIKHTAGGGRVQCEVCKKMFASKGSLLTHHQTHTGKKKYACKLCEESYNSRKDLTTHEKTIHITETEN